MQKQKIYVVDDIVNMRVVDVIERRIIEEGFEERVSYKNKTYLVTKDYNDDRFISLEERVEGTYVKYVVHPIPQRKKLTARNQKVNKGVFT